MRKAVSIAASLALTAGALLTNGASAAPPENAPAAAPATCEGSWIYVNVALVVRAEPNTGSSQRWITARGLQSCRKLVLGGRYDMCGHTNANGWIMIHFMSEDAPGPGLGFSGYIPSTCAEDYS